MQSNYIHFDNSCSFKKWHFCRLIVSANAGDIFLQTTSIGAARATLSAWHWLLKASKGQTPVKALQ